VSEEFGGVYDLKFTDHMEAKLYDSSRKEIEIPKCESCGEFMCQMIGKEKYYWICWNCPKT
tara:strand:+ start:2360 stop:2542 length:183 start_codon:yes stop_codon:yes gene_type:complete